MEKITSEHTSLYRILCVGPKSTKAEMKKAYYGQMKIYHPDKNPDKLDWANEHASKLNLAYSILMDDVKRKEYDGLLHEFELREKQKRAAEEQKRRNAEQRRKYEEAAKRQEPKTSAKSKRPEPVFQKANFDSSDALLGVAAIALLAFLFGAGKSK